MSEWQKKYHMMVRERDYWLRESKRLETSIETLKILCDEYKAELMSLKYKDAGKK